MFFAKINNLGTDYTDYTDLFYERMIFLPKYPCTIPLNVR